MYSRTITKTAVLAAFCLQKFESTSVKTMNTCMKGQFDGPFQIEFPNFCATLLHRKKKLELSPVFQT